MDIILKQRLVGAIVLISLGVIFIPMLLSGKGELSSPKLKSNIPPTPHYDIKKPAVTAMRTVTVPVMIAGEQDKPEKETEGLAKENKPVEAVDLETSESVSPVKQSPEIASVKSKTESKPKLPAVSPQQKPAKQENKVAQKPQPAAAKETAGQKIKQSQPAAISKPVKKQSQEKPKKTTPEQVKPGTITSWVVQVGSFRQRKNALKLRNKLRKKGFASFVETRKVSGETDFRVRVGPELKRAHAEELLKKLQKNEKLTGIVMSYPRR